MYIFFLFVLIVKKADFLITGPEPLLLHKTTTWWLMNRLYYAYASACVQVECTAFQSRLEKITLKITLKIMGIWCQKIHFITKKLSRVGLQNNCWTSSSTVFSYRFPIALLQVGENTSHTFSNTATLLFINSSIFKCVKSVCFLKVEQATPTYLRLEAPSHPTNIL